jgi:hypothetical protein
MTKQKSVVELNNLKSILQNLAGHPLPRRGLTDTMLRPRVSEPQADQPRRNVMT